ncbi:transposase [Neoroseomonas rubea]|uniref:transposase n=1 Tax=Neoroseomonas rubea TaxID=2748666 RepID=UPI0018E046FC|nr:transposase [Roseomonas rubea]
MRPHPFRPLTDAEFAILDRLLPACLGRPGRRGRPPQDRRRTLDAIFWVACSKGPWKALPPEFGRPDTASRQLRRWARSGHMDLLLGEVANRDRYDDLLSALAWRICRAYRRITKVLTIGSLMLLKRIGPDAALPAERRYLPDLNLSETARRLTLKALENPWAQPPGTFATLARLVAKAAGARWRWRLT